MNTNHMHTLTRQEIIARLRAANTPAAVHALPAWAFEQFYAWEEGKLALELGYRSVLSAVLDDVMFGDDPAFALTNDDVAQLIHRLEQAQLGTDDDDDEDEDDE